MAFNTLDSTQIRTLPLRIKLIREMNSERLQVGIFKMTFLTKINKNVSKIVVAPWSG